jgi:hypothetical protein
LYDGIFSATGVQTFITVSSADSAVVGAQPHLVRTYPTPVGEVSASPHNHQWLITEAILASLATPPYFEPLVIISNRSTFTYREPLGHNNPAKAALHEASRMFSRKHLGALISLGAGLPKLLDLKDASPVPLVQQWMHHLVKVSNDTEMVHENLSREL